MLWFIYLYLIRFGLMFWEFKVCLNKERGYIYGFDLGVVLCEFGFKVFIDRK